MNIPTTDIDLSHHIQRLLLVRLRQEGPLSYQALKPDGLEGNAYNYHLRLLKKAGLITLSNSLYQLSSTGHLVADAFSFDKKRLMLRPHVYTSLFVTSGSKVLLYLATRQPLKGRMSLPSGKIHFGDSFTDSIKREMERRNLQGAYAAKEYVALNIRYTLDGAVAYHRPGFVWHIEYNGELVERQTESGKTSWFELNSLPQGCLPEVTEILHRVTEGATTPIDLTWKLD